MLPSLTSDARELVGDLKPAGVFGVDRVIPAVAIQVRVARSGVYRVALQPASGTGVVLPCTYVVQPQSGVAAMSRSKRVLPRRQREL
jgi:hypothetical protein